MARQAEEREERAAERERKRLEIQAETKRYEVDLENRRLDLERERLEMQGTQGQNVKQVAMSHPRVSPKLPAFTEKENLDAYLS